MKMSRMLATMLSVVMLVCMVPVMQVSAAGVSNVTLMDAIGQVMGYDVAIPATNAIWSILNVDFADNYEPAAGDVTKDEGVTYGVNGITFPAGDNALKWKYADSANITSYGTWSPQAGATNYSFRFKLEPGGSLRQISPFAYKDYGIDINVTENGVVFYSNSTPVKEDVGYQPGTEWNDVLVYTLKNGEPATGVCHAYEVWMKKASDAQFTRLGTVNATSYTYAGASPANTGILRTDGLTFEGNGAYVKHAVSAQAFSGTYYNSVADVVGQDVLTKVALNPDASWNNAVPAYVYQATGTTYSDEKGAFLPSGGGAWYYNPSATHNGVVYSPLEDSVMRVKAQLSEGGGIVIQGNKPNATDGRAYVEVNTAGAIVYQEAGKALNKIDFAPGTEMVEYLIVAGEDGYNVYVNYSGTYHKWMLLASTAGWRAGRVYGLNLTGTGTAVSGTEVGAYVKEAEISLLVNTLDSTVADVVGQDVLTKVALNPDASWNDAVPAYVYQATGTTYSDEKGAFLPSGGGAWYYNPSATHNGVVYSPLEDSVMRVKAQLSEGGGIVIQANKPNATDGRAYVEVNTAGAIVYQEAGKALNKIDFAPGTEMVEYLIVAGEDGYNVYVKYSGTHNKWMLLASTAGWRAGRVYGLNLTGTGTAVSGTEVGAYVKEAEISLLVNTLDSTVADVVGQDVLTKVALNPDASWNDAVPAYVYQATGTTYSDEKGAFLPSGGGAWYYNPSATHNDVVYSPLEDSVMRVKAQLSEGGGIVIQANKPNATDGRAYVEVNTAGAIVYQEAGKALNKIEFVPGTEMVDYLIIATESGYNTYVKYSGTHNKWMLLASAAGWRAGRTPGLNLTGTGTAVSGTEVGAYVKEAEISLLVNTLDSTVADVVGQDVLTKVALNPDASWNDAVPAYVYQATGTTYSDEKGAFLPSGGGAWYYNPSATHNDVVYSPLEDSVMRVKAQLSEGGGIVIQANKPNATDGRAYVEVNTAGAIVYQEAGKALNKIEFAPGTEMVDYLIIATESGYNTYVKYSGTHNKWMLLASAAGWRAGRTPGLNLTGTGTAVSGTEVGAYVKEAEISLLVNALDSTVSDVVGQNVMPSVVLNPDVSWNDAVPAHIYQATGTTYSDEKGAFLPAGGGAWYYNPSNQKNAVVYSPLENGVMRVKAQLTEGGGIVIQANKPNATDGRAYVEVNTAGAIVYQEAGKALNKIDFAPGTEMVEYLIVPTESGYNTYVKYSGTHNKWMLLASTSGWRAGRVYGLNLTGAGTAVAETEVGAYVKEAEIILLTDLLNATVADVLGGNYTTTYQFPLDRSFDSTLNVQNDETILGIIQDGEYTIDGWKGTNWKFVPESGWKPLESGDEVTAIGFMAKMAAEDTSGFNVQGHFEGGRIYADITTRNYPVCNAPTRRFPNGLRPDNDWAEYLITKSENGSGFVIWMKSETVTANKWVQLLETDDVQTKDANDKSTAFPMRGFAIYDGGQDTLFKNVKVYTSDISKIYEAEDMLPANATYAYYTEDFDAKPEYKNFVAENATYDGDLVLTLEEDPDPENPSVVLNNVSIPVGGYAEFSLKIGNSVPTIRFYDGAKMIALTPSVNYAKITGSEIFKAYVGEGGEVYRVWRIVHNAKGIYSIYCKVVDENGENKWYAVQEFMPGKNSTVAPKITISGSLSYDEYSAGITELDYLKVYGVAPEAAEMILFDGYGTKVLKDGDKATCPEEVRLVLSAAEVERTLLVAESKDGVLQNLEKISVAIGETDKSYEAVGTDTELRFFLWEGKDFSAMKPCTNAIKLIVE